MADATLPPIDTTPTADANGTRMDQDVPMKEEPYSEVCQLCIELQHLQSCQILHSFALRIPLSPT